MKRLECRELAERIESALLLMTGPQRDVIVYTALCGMSAAEAGRALGIASDVAFRKLLSRARRRLRELVGE